MRKCFNESRATFGTLEEKRGAGIAADNGDCMIRAAFKKQFEEMKDGQERAWTLFQSGVAASDLRAPMENIGRLAQAYRSRSAEEGRASAAGFSADSV